MVYGIIAQRRLKWWRDKDKSIYINLRAITMIEMRNGDRFKLWMISEISVMKMIESRKSDGMSPWKRDIDEDVELPKPLAVVFS